MLVTTKLTKGLRTNFSVNKWIFIEFISKKKTQKTPKSTPARLLVGHGKKFAIGNR